MALDVSRPTAEVMITRGAAASRLVIRSTTTLAATTSPRTLRHLPGALPHLHHQNYHYKTHYGRGLSTWPGLTSFETTGNDGRYEQDVNVVRVDRDGTMGKQTTSIKELLLSTEVHVSPLV